VASFHTIFMDKRIWIEALKRGAIQYPDVDVIGHLAPESTFLILTIMSFLN
jgi:hypothetical protein